MTAYATVAELRHYLPQVAATAENDSLLATILDRATAIVETALGFTFTAYASSATARGVWCEGGTYLVLPPYNTATAPIVKFEGVTDADWEADPDSSRHLLKTYDTGVSSSLGYWMRGRYYVTAKWGYGDPPAAVVEITLQVAVNLWRSRDAGRFSDVVGVEGGGAVGYNRAFTNQQRQVLDAVRAAYGHWGFA